MFSYPLDMRKQKNTNNWENMSNSDKLGRVTSSESQKLYVCMSYSQHVQLDGSVTQLHFYNSTPIEMMTRKWPSHELKLKTRFWERFKAEMLELHRRRNEDICQRGIEQVFSRQIGRK